MFEYAFSLAREPQENFSNCEQAQAYLKQICARSRVLHLSYRYSPEGAEYAPEADTWIATYDPAYMEYYNHYIAPRGDLMLETVRSDCMMVDWVDWADSDIVTQTLLAAAQPYGITRYGITMPLRKEGQGTVMFSVNITSDRQQWQRARGDLFLRFLSFGHYFHQRMEPLLHPEAGITKAFTRAA